LKKAYIWCQCEWPAIQSVGLNVISGVIGTLLLAGFFSSIMSLETLSILLALVFGFNAAVSGYRLIERDEEAIKHKKALSAAVGLAVAMISAISINVFCYQTGGFFLLSAVQALVAVMMGLIGGWSGGVLAVKYRQLKASESIP
jgi:hypothetical protein